MREKQDWLFIYDPSLRKIIVFIRTCRLRATKPHIILCYLRGWFVSLSVAMTVIRKSQYRMRVHILKYSSVVVCIVPRPNILCPCCGSSLSSCHWQPIIGARVIVIFYMKFSSQIHSFICSIVLQIFGCTKYGSVFNVLYQNQNSSPQRPVHKRNHQVFLNQDFKEYYVNLCSIKWTKLSSRQQHSQWLANAQAGR